MGAGAALQSGPSLRLTPRSPSASVRGPDIGPSHPRPSGVIAALEKARYKGEFARPRHFDVARAEHAEIPVNGGAYDLILIGPNGFRREFAGTVRDTAEVSSALAPGLRDLRITLRNTGRTPLRFRLASLAYGHRRREVTVPPRQSRTVNWHTRHGWYDVEIKVAGHPSFRRRLMGHIENGRPSVSG
ncbi:hypothetical protein Arub01_30580 [Actinomadura rubrobrunea]|uniref:Bacterial phospholipase C C-terminal domain-containing protein n=1 Tax=Actinomadura rubrobrunea TaxID=115335 RepID=A0A9W6PUM9_9ACTN|nr:phospholipase domain-containing protein [Actinomadura rubrobrunea]GLW64814.1 hypothetical protein Arub01_30580 [Actinomadura rubrobrunea]